MQYCVICFKVPVTSFFPQLSRAHETWLNSSPPGAAYVCQRTGSVLVQIIACRLFGAKPLPDPMLTCCELHHYEQTFVKFKSKYKTFHSWKWIWKMATILSGEVEFKMGHQRFIVPVKTGKCVPLMCFRVAGQDAEPRLHRQDDAGAVPGLGSGHLRPGHVCLDRRHRRGHEVQDQDPRLRAQECFR